LKRSSIIFFGTFKQKHSLHNLKVKGKLVSANVIEEKEYPTNCWKYYREFMHSRSGVQSWRVWTVLEKMPKRSYMAKFNTKPSGNKAVKDSITILFYSSASDDHLMKPLVINKAKMLHAFKGIRISNLPIYWIDNTKAWVTVTIFKYWLNKCLVPDAKNYLKKKALPLKVLQLINNAPDHSQDLQ